MVDLHHFPLQITGVYSVTTHINEIRGIDMSLIIGIDGGGTKTRGILLNATGTLLADISVGPSNYQIIGKDFAKNTLSSLLNKLVKAANNQTISFIYFGLSGADMPHDFDILNRLAKEICLGIAFEIGNDTWCVFRSAITQSWGAVSLYGTGANAAAIGVDGRQHILRALNYMAGGVGGGDEIASSALHFAFRANEGTAKNTLLEEKLPELLGVSSMEAVLDFVYPDFKIATEDFKKIPPLVFQLAGCGDGVCQEILEDAGRVQGKLVAGMISRANLNAEAVPVVLGGSVFNGTTSHFIDAMMVTIHTTCPLAFPVHIKLPAVAGAALMAAERSNFELDDNFYQVLQRQFL